MTGLETGRGVPTIVWRFQSPTRLPERDRSMPHILFITLTMTLGLFVVREIVLPIVMGLPRRGR